MATSSNISLIIPLVDAQRSRKAGGRAVNLSRLIAARFAVPRGFVISADAHSFHLWASGVREIEASFETPEARQSTREAIISADIPGDIWAGIEEAYHRLSLQVGFADPKVVVCPSAVEGNRAGAECCLSVVAGLDALKSAIKYVWASAWGERMCAGESVSAGDPAVAVIVRQVIENGPRGVACTADPVTGDPRSVVITCDKGENGSARFVVDLRDVRIAEREGELPEGLDESAIVRLAEQSVLAERVVCSPMRIEWIYEGGVFWIVQAGAVDGSALCEPSADTGKPRGRRLSSRPVSHLARRLFWAVSRGVELHGGYAFCSGDAVEGDTQGWQPAAERLLEKWRKDAPDMASRASAIISADLKSVERVKLVELMNEAAGLAVSGMDWLGKMRQPCARYPEALRETLSGFDGGAELCERIMGGLDCPSFMRDARLQELGDRFGVAQRSGKLDDESWWRAYRREVGEFAVEYGYSFCDVGEICDPASWKSWVEDVDTVFRMIGAIARRGSGASLVTLHCAAAESAARAEKDAAMLVKPADKAKFGKLVKAVRGWLGARDECEQAFALACTALRLAAMEMGRRLAEGGVIALKEDVFCLTASELCAITGEPTDNERAELVATIAARKHEVWLEERLAGQEKDARDDAAGDLLRGRSVVSGSVAGRARVVHSVADAGELDGGEIMVVKRLSLAWTPFMGVAGGLISETDGEGLPAIAGDYGVPVIAGCTGAVIAVEDGRRICLNGDDGTVDLHGG